MLEITGWSGAVIVVRLLASRNLSSKGVSRTPQFFISTSFRSLAKVLVETSPRIFMSYVPGPGKLIVVAAVAPVIVCPSEVLMS